MESSRGTPIPADGAPGSGNVLGGVQSSDHLSPFLQPDLLLNQRMNVFPDITVLEEATSNEVSNLLHKH